MELHQSSQEEENLAEISQLPIPSFAAIWDSSIRRPTTLQERYDTRISAKYIFYLPFEKRYVVSQRCDGCAKAQQACDRALPGCSRCVRSKKECHISDKSYVTLPGPKAERTGIPVFPSHERKEKSHRKSADIVRAKRQLAVEHKQKKPIASGKYHQYLIVRRPLLT